MPIMDIKDGVKRRGVGYIRISDKKQIIGESPETQRRLIQQYADDNNIEIVEWFYDEAKSGRNNERKELQNLLQFAVRNSNRIDVVIVYKLNRGSRDVMSYYSGIKYILAGKGISIRSASEPMVDDTPFGRFIEGSIVLNGQLDNEIKGTATIDNMRSLAQQGYWQHGPMVGYDKYSVLNDLRKPRPSIKPNSMAPLVKQVLERFGEGDINPMDLMRYANQIGLKTPGYIKKDGTRVGPKKLGKNSIYSLIRRPENAGYVHDKFTDYKLVEGKHDAIISRELYWHNQKLLKKTAAKVGYSKRNKTYFLKDTLLCPGCGRPYYGSAPKTGGGKSHSARYHCFRSDCKGTNKGSIRAQDAHNAYYGLLKQIQPAGGLLKGYKEILIRQAARENARLNEQIKVKRDELDDTSTTRLAAIEDSVTSSPERKLELSELLDHLNSKKLVQQDELDKLVDKQTVQEAKVEYAIRHMHNIAKQWLDADYDLRLRFQSMVFPEGTTLDIATMQFGTDKISPLYRYIPNKKDLSESEKSSLVTPAGFEPAIFRMRT